MVKFNVLDCTLRDGGYVNNWMFGQEIARDVVANLCASGVEFVELGYLRDEEYEKERTVFSHIEQVNNLILDFSSQTKFLAMIDYGKFEMSKIVPKTENVKLDGIRVAFKKNDINSVFDYLKQVKDAGYCLFVNPTSVDAYSDDEFVQLVNRVNELKPYSFSLVDTNGGMTLADLKRLFDLINKNLSEDILPCFHFHNNLKLAFSLAQYLISVAQRDLIIDSTILGIGRATGNVCTELLVSYINNLGVKKYQTEIFDALISKYFEPIYAKFSWGEATPYYLSAVNHCHPNYAKFLVEHNVSPSLMSKCFEQIPQENKFVYNQAIIEQLCRF